jgi:dienelactone hydrolase
MQRAKLSPGSSAADWLGFPLGAVEPHAATIAAAASAAAMLRLGFFTVLSTILRKPEIQLNVLRRTVAGVLVIAVVVIWGARATAAGVGPRVAVAERVITFTYRHRTIRLPDGAVVPRSVTTVIRYPARATQRLPLIVFAHGFAVTPAPYAALLRAWAAAGYVVAAPIFPLSNAHAPGGPDEADIVNQPADVSLVITGLEQGPLAGVIDRRAIAVAGQSDGGITALMTAYDPGYRDTRVDAAVILSGAALPGFTFEAPSLPLLASQGTADTTNLPQNTYAYFSAAPRPKYLLQLLGAAEK